MRVPVLLCVAICSLLVIEVSSSQLQLQPAFPHLKFTHPVDLQHAGDGTNRIFVVDLEGVIHVFPNDSNVTSSTVFLDIQDRVDYGEGEQGLWGLAFHPDYENNGYFYVRYSSDNTHSVLSMFKVSDADPNVAEPDSEVVFLNIAQDAVQHYGGQVAFGPNDGYLYTSTGDGANGGDPSCYSQNLQSMRGKILRIDVDTPANGNHYGIPPENPFFGNTQGYLEEIYAYGFRNPWRFSIDPATDWLWLGDVGSATWEEVDLVEAGMNYGWNINEGNHCSFSPYVCTPPCDTPGLQPPIWEFDHNVGEAVMGGHVYRGPSVPELVGKYVYADLGTGTFWSLEYADPPINTQLFVAFLTPVAFGVDQNNELYICAFQPDSSIYRFKPTFTPIPCSDITSMSAKCLAGGVIRVRVTLLNSTIHAGEQITVAIDDSQFTSTIVTNGTHSRADFTVAGWSVGQHIISLVEPAGCLTDKHPTCAVSDDIAKADPEWDDDAEWTVSAQDVPQTTQVLGNYPNPFNPSTNIRYGLSHDAWVTLKIYNTLGQEVTTLVNEFQTAGYKSVTWEGRNAGGEVVAAGVYVYTIRAGNVMKSGKMIMTK